MANRPLGIYLVCGFFGFMGVVLPISSLMISGESVLGEFPQSVQLFAFIFPIFAFLFGLLALFAAVTLWYAYPIGRLSGLLWAGLWATEEIIVGIWGATGPEIVQQASSGFGKNLRNILIASVLFYYLWTAGETYIEDNRTDAESSLSSDN